MNQAVLQVGSDGPLVEYFDAKHGIYKVYGSKGNPYLVNVGRRTCGCIAGTYGFEGTRSGTCRHLRAALEVDKSLNKVLRGGQPLRNVREVIVKELEVQA